MTDTFSQLYIQVVFAVKGRESLIKQDWDEQIYKYITGIIRAKEQKVLAINGVEDHIHIFIGIRPTCCISDLVREVKKSSNDFVNDKKFTIKKFSWQGGYGAFSYSHSQLDTVIKYVMNQKEHHKKISFKDEYIDLLKKFEIEFDEKYLFEWLD